MLKATNVSCNRAWILFILLPLLSFPAVAADDPAAVSKEVGVEEKLNTKLDLDLEFTNRAGENVKLRELLIPGRPAIITPVYYRCPMLCPLTFRGITTLLNELSLSLGSDFSIISISMNPAETEEHAAETAEKNFEQLDQAQGAKKAWHFLTGSEENVQTVMDQLGFIYRPDGEEFMHTAAFMVITPLGTISRYFYGVTYDDKDVRLALVEASEGKIGSTVDRVFLYCFRFDPSKGKYTPLVMNIMRLTCGTVFAGLAFTLLGLRVAEIRGRKSDA